MEQARTSYDKLMRDIRNELDSLLEETATLKDVYANAVKSEELARRYYLGVMQRYRQGRFSAMMIKEAMDNYTKSRLVATKTLVGYNIAGLRLDFSQNRVFERFGISEKFILGTLRQFAK